MNHLQIRSKVAEQHGIDSHTDILAMCQLVYSEHNGSAEADPRLIDGYKAVLRSVLETWDNKHQTAFDGLV